MAPGNQDMLRTHRWPGMRRCSLPGDRKATTCCAIAVLFALTFIVMELLAFVVPSPPEPFFVVQLTDPQFGLQDSNVDWRQEQAMLNLSLLIINQLAPRLLCLTGDLQNVLPTSTGTSWPMPRPNGTHAAHPGADQAAAVAQSLTLLDASIPIRATIPGNHDVGYAPTLATLERFTELWGGERAAFDEGGVAFVALDSQLYFDASEPGVAAQAEAQTAWLSQQLDNAADRGVAGVVLLSHVPPFLVSADEPTGWANWPSDTRARLLAAMQAKRVPPSLIVNGHFHANVEGVHTAAFGPTDLEVVTTSAVGCAIRWNGTTAASMPHATAAAVAAARTGRDAFQRFILRNGTATGTADPSLIRTRSFASPSVSGVRLFEFDARTGYRHAWFTLHALGELSAPLRPGEASPLAGKAFTPWARRVREERK